MISRFVSSSPTSGSPLSARSWLRLLCPLLSAPPPLALSKINIKKKREREGGRGPCLLLLLRQTEQPTPPCGFPSPPSRLCSLLQPRRAAAGQGRESLNQPPTGPPVSAAGRRNTGKQGQSCGIPGSSSHATGKAEPLAASPPLRAPPPPGLVCLSSCGQSPANTGPRNDKRIKCHTH